MKRSIYNDLLEWKQTVNRKPLILRGARQVGKTYILTELGQNEYRNTVYLNFEKKPFLGKIFEKDLSIDRIITEIELEFNTKIDPQETLIIFDEIQECQNALKSLKYFCEDSSYNIASAGSLLGLKIGEGSFPVGKVTFLDLFPLNFSEFLIALGEDKLSDYLVSQKKIEGVSDNIHSKCMDYIRLYFCVGGMPEAVKSYAEKRDLPQIRELQFDLLSAYVNDFSKHTGKNTALRIHELWNAVPKQLAKEQKKFKYSDIKKGARTSQYEEAILWLSRSRLCHKIERVTEPRIPISSYADPSYFKLIPLDIGLLSAQNNLPIQMILKEENLFGTYKGALTESFAGQELKAYGLRNLYYWKSKYMAEMDYLFEGSDGIYPIEVKSGKSGKLKSLNVYDEKYQPKYRIRISGQNFYQRNNFINLPLYGIKTLFNL